LMRPLTHILVPVDLSAVSRPLALTSGRIAKRYDAEVTLLHVIEEGIVIHVAGGYDVESLVRSLEERARRLLGELRSELEAMGVKVRVYDDIPVGDPGAVIPEVASEVGASEIFMASKGAGLERIIPIGSTLKAAVGLTRVPIVRFKVVLGEGGQPEILAGDDPFEYILVGLDENASKEMIEYSVALAARSGGRILFLHVAEQEEPTQHVKNALRLAEKKASDEGVRFETMILTGPPAKVIAQVSEQLPVTSVLVGRTVQKSLIEYIVGSTLDRLLKTVRKPLIIYPL